MNCSIPITVIRGAPFYLDWGNSVQVQIIAINIVGQSSISTNVTTGSGSGSGSGSGVVIVTTPDAPINVASIVNITYGS